VLTLLASLPSKRPYFANNYQYNSGYYNNNNNSNYESRGNGQYYRNNNSAPQGYRSTGNNYKQDDYNNRKGGRGGFRKGGQPRQPGTQAPGSTREYSNNTNNTNGGNNARKAPAATSAAPASGSASAAQTATPSSSSTQQQQSNQAKRAPRRTNGPTSAAPASGAAASQPAVVPATASATSQAAAPAAAAQVATQTQAQRRNSRGSVPLGLSHFPPLASAAAANLKKFSKEQILQVLSSGTQGASSSVQIPSSEVTVSSPLTDLETAKPAPAGYVLLWLCVALSIVFHVSDFLSFAVRTE
jgi:hypothetical protein